MTHDNTLRFTLAGRECRLETGPAPEVLLVEPIDENDLGFLQRETDYLTAHAPRPFALATFLIRDWNRELTPWAAEPVFGKEPFGAGAPQTLAFITEALIPQLEQRYPALAGAPVVLGGYSLAALFALWAGYESSRFAGIAAASPSVWYPGWLDYARARQPQAGRIYLSLGDAEERTRNRTMATVGACIREQSDLLARQGIDATLEWNPGNHFQDTDLRTAKGFVWAMGGAAR